MDTNLRVDTSEVQQLCCSGAVTGGHPVRPQRCTAPVPCIRLPTYIGTVVTIVGSTIIARNSRAKSKQKASTGPEQAIHGEAFVFLRCLPAFAGWLHTVDPLQVTNRGPTRPYQKLTACTSQASAARLCPTAAAHATFAWEHGAYLGDQDPCSVTSSAAAIPDSTTPRQICGCNLSEWTVTDIMNIMGHPIRPLLAEVCPMWCAGRRQHGVAGVQHS